MMKSTMRNSSITFPRESLTTISRVETVLSLNGGDAENRDEETDQLGSSFGALDINESNYLKLQKDLNGLHHQLNRVKTKIELIVS